MVFYKEIKCGTYSGYQRHYRLGEPACVPCKAGAVVYTSTYYYKNKKKIYESKKKNSKYRQRKAIQKSRRKARKKRNRVGPYTLEQVLELYGTNCYICSKPIDFNAPRVCGKPGWENGLHLDHVIDIQYGGADAIDNVKPTHALCNLKKNAKNKNGGSPLSG
jgi:5-methylcytosine-specific restriction endonuclease McrA